MAIAACLAWLATRLVPSTQSFMAPYTAVFLMAETVYRSLTIAAQQTAALMVGMVLAYLGANLIPAPLAVLGVTVFVGMLLGQWHRFGANGVWVGVTALLLVTYGTAQSGHYLMQRLAETLIGAVVGVAVNTLVFPPVALRRTRAAGRALAGEIRELLTSMADELVDDWTVDSAKAWLRRARRLDETVRHAKETRSWGRESTRFNLRWRLFVRAPRKPTLLEASIGTLGEVTEQVQRITEALVTDEPIDDEFAKRYAEILRTLADSVGCYEDSLDEEHEETRVLADQLDEVREKQRELADWVYDGRHLTVEARQTEDALLLSASHTVRVLAGDRPVTH